MFLLFRSMREFKPAAAWLPLLLTTLCSWYVLVDAQYRLPDTTQPVDYVVSLKATLEGGVTPFSFEGTVTINVLVVKSTRTITLHANRLSIIEMTVRDSNQQSIQQGRPTLSTDDTHFLEIQLTRQVSNSNHGEQHLFCILEISYLES